MFLLAFLVFSVIGQSVAADANDESRLNYLLAEEQLSNALLSERHLMLVGQLDNTGADVEQILTSLYYIELSLEDSEPHLAALIAEAQGLGLTDLAAEFTQVQEANQNLDQTIELLLDYIDADRDAQPVDIDNCPANANANQADADGDGRGDACDTDNDEPTDTDGDGILNGVDNCPANANANQADVDGDNVGDVCDTNNTNGPLADADGDGILNGVDNCPANANADQANTDQDSLGNVCDATPNGDAPAAPQTYQQRFDGLENQFQGYEDDYEDDFKDNYNGAVRKDDEDDIEDAEDDLKELKDDLKELRNQAKDLEDEVESNDADNDNLLDDLSDLVDDITDLRDEVSALLSGETTDTNQNDFDYVSDYTPPAATPTGNVILEPLQLPPGDLVLNSGQAASTATGTQWENIRNMVWIAGGVVILLAIILFLIALLIK